MAVARKIAYNVAVSSFSKILSTILALVSIAFITRYLGKEGFGNYATVLAFLSFFSAIADLGLYSISTREISKDGADETRIMGNVFALRIISSLAIVVIAPLLAMAFPYPAEVKKGIVIVALSFVFSSGYQVLNGVFQKNLAMDKVAVAELLGKILQVGVVICAVKINLGFSWIVAALLFNMILSFLLVFFWSKKYLRFRMKFNFEYWKNFLCESMPLGAVAVITFAYFKMDTLILSLVKTSGEVGIYNAAYKVLENITFFPAMIVGLVFPLMAKNIFKNPEIFSNISNKTFKVFIILTVPLVIGTLFLSNQIINVIGGEGFKESAAVLRILVFALAFIFFGNFFNSILIAANRQKTLMRILGIVAVINIALNLIFIPKFSYFGAAATSVITEFLVVILTFRESAKKANFIPRLEKAGAILLSGGLMAVFLVLFSQGNFILSALGSSFVYLAGLWLSKAITTEEIKSLISKKGVQEYGEIS